MFNLAAVRDRLPDREVYWHPSLDSTMYEAQRLAALGCPSGTLAGAEEQVSGIGRHGHAWHSEPEAGLYFTIVLRLASTAPVLTLMLGISVQEAIANVCGVRCDLRWPNDLLIGDKKVCGILTQLHEGAILAGIGINANHMKFPEPIADIATSLRLAAGRAVRREDLLVAILEAIDRNAQLGKEDVLRIFAQGSSYVQGRRVIVDQVRGTTAGLNADGFLLLETQGSGQTVIFAGGVRPDPAA